MNAIKEKQELSKKKKKVFLLITTTIKRVSGVNLEIIKFL